MPIRDRRKDYSWGVTKLDRLRIDTDKRSYSEADTVKLNVSFRVVGGLREAFHPDVWTVAWEDFDKRLRLAIKVGVKSQGSIGSRTLAEIKKEVRKASFYWSRDPDLPYRIWAMVVPEDGGPPKIPRNVEDAKAKMFDVEKEFSIPASALGRGSHRLFAEATAKWGRRSFIEKGEATARSAPAVVKVE